MAVLTTSFTLYCFGEEQRKLVAEVALQPTGMNGLYFGTPLFPRPTSSAPSRAWPG
jgi:hypothetical protein